MILDRYTARLRSMPMPPDSGADQQLQNSETAAVVDRAIADVDRLTRVIERQVPLSGRLRELADVAQRAGVRVSIELHRLPSAAPEIPPRG